METEHKILNLKYLIGKKFKGNIMRRRKTAESDATEMMVEEEIHKYGYHREA